MTTRIAALTEQQDALAGQLVDSGRYESTGEVLRDSLRLLQDQLERHQAETDDIRAGVLEGLEPARREDFVEGTAEEVIHQAFAEARDKRGQ